MGMGMGMGKGEKTPHQKDLPCCMYRTWRCNCFILLEGADWPTKSLKSRSQRRRRVAQGRLDSMEKVLLVAMICHLRNATSLHVVHLGD